MQTILASVQSLVGGLKQVNDEVRQVQKMRIPQDRFVIIMQVSIRTTQPQRGPHPDVHASHSQCR